MEARATSISAPEVGRTRDGSNAAWHALSPDEALAAAGGDTSGLSGSVARARLERVGPNVIPRGPRESSLAVLSRQLDNPLIWVLLAAGALAIALGKGVDGTVVLGVVVANTLIGFIQEIRATRAIEALSGLVTEEALVVRGGDRVTVPAADVVPGDLVVLERGNRVPADIRLHEIRELEVDEAMLTGESMPVAKSTAAVDVDTALADRRGMAYGGTAVVAGTGTGVAVATGSHTELGRIASMLRGAPSLETRLTRSLATVARVLTIVITLSALVLFAIGLVRGYPLADATLAAITLAVAAIPEGLPAIITIALAVGVQRMARRRAVVRRLPAVETLGSTTVVCSDKTGTLTTGEMAVVAIATPAGRYELRQVGGDEGRIVVDGRELEAIPADVRELALAGALCNEAPAHFDGHWTIGGTPTEHALTEAAIALGIDVPEERAVAPVVDEVPFDAERKLMGTLHARADGGRMLLVKGAPEAVIARTGGRSAARRDALAAADALAARGMRVIAVARRLLNDRPDRVDEADLADGFELLGLEGIHDPPRPEAIEAVAACRSAGIRVKMVTGDHASTAAAIAERFGLAGTAPVRGPELDETSDEALAQVAGATDVFARVAPEHKLRLVRALQRRGEVVAMTGDGVNDAPGLKSADVGVAMGVTGTAPAREAADVVLMDDNFASIRAAVEEGRRVYDNIVKALAFVLPTNLGEALIMLVAVLAFPIVDGEPLLPMEPVQILWINLVATVTLALPLAFEAMEPDAMHRPPRRADEPILSRFVLWRTAIVALLVVGGAIAMFLTKYWSVEGQAARLAIVPEAQTAAVTTVVMFQIFYLLSCRSLTGSIRDVGLWSNPAVYLGIGALLLLQASFIYVPFMQDLFHSAPIDGGSWLAASAFAVVVLPVVALEKRLRRRAHASPSG